jgi:hypothetical protein
MNRLVAGEIPYREYAFLAEGDCGSDGFKVEYGDHLWANTDGNDTLLMFIASLPQCVWLKLYWDPRACALLPGCACASGCTFARRN